VCIAVGEEGYDVLVEEEVVLGHPEMGSDPNREMI